jgi:hypothetical protein
VFSLEWKDKKNKYALRASWIYIIKMKSASTLQETRGGRNQKNPRVPFQGHAGEENESAKK